MPPASQAGGPYTNFNPAMDRMTSQMGTLSVTQSGFDKLWVILFYQCKLYVNIIYLSRVMIMLICYKCATSYQAKELRRRQFVCVKII